MFKYLKRKLKHGPLLFIFRYNKIISKYLQRRIQKCQSISELNQCGIEIHKYIGLISLNTFESLLSSLVQKRTELKRRNKNNEYT